MFFATHGCGGPVVGAECEEEMSLCANGCYNLSVDELNCGQCGQTCPADQVCVSGACVPDCGLLIWCVDECVDTRTDHEHCGQCNAPCELNEGCISSSCVVQCDPGLAACSGDCVDIQTHASHCGSCDTPCPTTHKCEGGECVLDCDVGTINCHEECIDPLTDSLHCGGCDQPCAIDRECRGGQCECLLALTECNGECVDTQTDDAHCGQCDQPCASDEACETGECVIQCDPGLLLCDGECIDPLTNSLHCGDCDQPCGIDHVCQGGECVIDCDDGLVDCNDECVNTQTDPLHCGDCNQPCELDEECAQGECIPDCGELTWCGEECVDLTTDDLHCGECDNPCAGGWECQSSECYLICDPPLTNCDNECVDLQIHPLHCGDCFVECESGICLDGDCREEAVGHLIAIGHDFMTNHATLRRLLGNAIFIAPKNPVTVLAYGEFADQTAGGHVELIDGIIDAEAELKGRTWTKTSANQAAAVIDSLLNHRVLLVYRQVLGTDLTLGAVGAGWSAVLDQFFRLGGIAVFIDAAGTNAGTWQIFEGAGVFDCTGITAIIGATAEVVDPGDAVAQGLVSQYFATQNSAYFLTTEPDIVVQELTTTNPFVIHKIISGSKDLRDLGRDLGSDPDN